MKNLHHSEIDQQEQEKRKRYLGATIITCIAAAMIFGVLHVVKLGAIRMNEMKNKATYDLADVKDHIRAAGEDITIHTEDDQIKHVEKTYEWDKLVSLLPEKQWHELEKMVLVPKGPFLMGTNLERADDYDKPRHKVSLPAYKIDKYPVTYAEYAKFIVTTKHRAPIDWKDGTIPGKKYLYPVTMVSWFDARDFCSWAGKRLPSEAEWEKAARGTDARVWPWGNKMDPEKLNTYYHVEHSTVVTKYKNGVSPYGVFDMAGNVSEWTNSDFVPYKNTTASPITFKVKKLVASTPEDRQEKVAGLVETKGVYKVRRGGSWKSDPFSTATYHRNFSLPNYASDFFGFRCAADVSK